MTRWFHEFASKFPFFFPDDYTTIDTETSGTDPENSLICSIGHSVVRGRKLVETSEVFLNWQLYDGVDHAKLASDLLEVEESFATRGQPMHHSLATLKELGEHPIGVLERYMAMFDDMEQRGELLVAHNGWHFDIELFQAHFHNFLGISWIFKPTMVYDSGLAEKAQQLPASDRPLPFDHETPRDYFWRMSELKRYGVRWALDQYCDLKYGLFKKAGIDPAAAHSAGVDSQLLYFLFEEQRRQKDSTDASPYKPKPAWPVRQH